MARLFRLLRCGRLEAARQLCQHVGQPWRAASLGSSGGMGLTPLGALHHTEHPHQSSEDGLMCLWPRKAVCMGEIISAAALGAGSDAWKSPLKVQYMVQYSRDTIAVSSHAEAGFVRLQAPTRLMSVQAQLLKMQMQHQTIGQQSSSVQRQSSDAARFARCGDGPPSRWAAIAQHAPYESTFASFNPVTDICSSLTQQVLPCSV